jgi:hypothetical protein
MQVRHWLVAVALCATSVVAQAQQEASDPVGLRGDISGLWLTPGLEGQGIQIDVLDGGRALLTWYTYDASGAPLWLYGLGTARGAVIEANVGSASGGRFATTIPPTAPDFVERGLVRIEFSGCNGAELSFQSADESVLQNGAIALNRLTAPQGQRCNAEEEFSEQRIFSFERGAGMFMPLFADLPDAGQDIYELDFAWEALPAPLQARRGLRLSGHNRSDDLAMLVVAPLRGLPPDTVHDVELELELASNVPTGCFGVGGSPGEGVYLKLGAVTEEPKALRVDEGGNATLRLNFDYGSQSQPGQNSRVVGNLSNTQTCDDPNGEWELKTVSSRGQPLRARSDADGTLWVFAGTDSAFEGLTHVYFTSLRVRLLGVEEAAR